MFALRQREISQTVESPGTNDKGEGLKNAYSNRSTTSTSPRVSLWFGAELSESKMIDWKTLDQHVIAVAVEGAIGDWAAYIGAVPGKRHSTEWQDVLTNGSKLPRKVAEILFPEFKHLLWRE